MLTVSLSTTIDNNNNNNDNNNELIYEHEENINVKSKQLFEQTQEVKDEMLETRLDDDRQRQQRQQQQQQVPGNRRLSYNLPQAEIGSLGELEINIFDESTHKYRVAIDIRSVKFDKINKNVQLYNTNNDSNDMNMNVILKYEFCIDNDNKIEFQTKKNEIVFNHRNINNIHNGNEQAVVNGFCAFECQLKPLKLFEIFKKNMLIIQCFDCIHNYIKIGHCFINLSKILFQNFTQINNVNNNDKDGNSNRKAQFIDSYYQIVPDIPNTLFGNMYESGQIRVCCSLEDFGPIVTQTVAENGYDKVGQQSQLEDVDATNFVNHAKLMQNEIMKELNEWKGNEQSKFTQKLQILSDSHILKLTEEFKKQEMYRINQLNVKKLELTKLEKKLKTSFYDLECQERKIKCEISRLQEKENEMNSIFKLKNTEISHSLKRMKSEHKYECEALNRAISFLKNENELITKKYETQCAINDDLRNDILKIKKQNEQSTVGQLKLQLNLKTDLLNEKENNIVLLKQEISNLKNELKLSLKEISKLHKKIYQKDSQYIAKEKKQIEKLKIEWLAKNEFRQLRNDKNKLRGIREDLNKIMANVNVNKNGNERARDRERDKEKENVESNNNSNIEQDFE